VEIETCELCVQTDDDSATLLPKEPTPLQKMLSPIYAMISPVSKMLPSLPQLPPSPMRPDPAKNGLLHETGCPWCGGRVYAAEKLMCFGKEWHRGCFKCINCTKTLTLGSQLDHDRKPFCKPCHTRSFGPKGYGFGGAVSAASHAAVKAEAEVIEAAAHSSDPALEQAMVEWVAMVTGMELDEHQPTTVLQLKSGVALCALVNKFEPNLLRVPFPRPRAPFNELENLMAYARGCQQLGLPNELIFPAGALHQSADLDRVVSNLKALFDLSGSGEYGEVFQGGKLHAWVTDKRVRKWISDVSGTSVMGGDLHVHLRDGTILCRLANQLQPGLVAAPLLKPATSKFGVLETIAGFLEAARELGVPDHDLFLSKDLYEGTAMEAVVRAIVALARTAVRRADYEGPKLEMPPQSYEESISMHRDSAVLSANYQAAAATARRASTQGLDAPAASKAPADKTLYSTPYAGSENEPPPPPPMPQREEIAPQR
jgi:hypothetical protein